MKNLSRVICIGLLLFACFCATAASSSEIKSDTKLLRVAVYPYTPPYQFIDEEGNLAGLHIDILEEIAKTNHYDLSYTIYHSKTECVQALDDNHADIVLGYQAYKYNTIDHLVVRELSNATLSVAAKQNLSEYIQKGGDTRSFHISYEYGVDLSLLSSMGFSYLVCSGNQEQMVDKMLSGYVDLIAGNRESIDYILSQKGVNRDYSFVYGMVANIEYSILVNKNAPTVYRIMERSLDELHATGNYEKIRAVWIKDYSSERLQSYIRFFVSFVVLAAIIVFIVLKLNYSMKKKVESKTKELHDANQLLEEMIEKLQNESAFRNRMIDSLPIGAILFYTDYSIELMNSSAYIICKKISLTQRALPCGTDIRTLPVFGEILSQLNGDIFSPAFSLPENQTITISDEEPAASYRYWLHLLLEGRRCTGALMLVENITKEEHRRRELFAMEKASTLERVVAGIAHEIKNPLMTIKTAVSLVRDQWTDPEVRAAFTQFVPEEVEKINAMVESLLNYSKPPSEKFMELKLFSLLQRSFYLASMTNKRRGKINFSTFAQADPSVSIQQGLFQQALTNLIINAIWAVNQKREDSHLEDWMGEISGTVTADEKWAYLSICDNGAGMSADVLNRCTEPFYTTKMAGTGLGLALAKQCVENNHGSMSIKSKEGEYTEILICLPVCQTPD